MFSRNPSICVSNNKRVCITSAVEEFARSDNRSALIIIIIIIWPSVYKTIYLSSIFIYYIYI